MLTYVFAPGDIDWEQGVVRAVGWRAGRWVDGRFPMPDVVYNRIQTRAMEGRDEAQQALNRFERMPSVKLFNRQFLDKWDVHRLLLRTPSIGRYVPPTALLSNSSTLKSLFAHSDRLFVKPVDGSLGRGIAVVERRTDGTYAYRHHGEAGTAVRRHSTIDELWLDLHPRVAGHACIVQSDIRLARYRRRRFDIRVIVQRGRDGRWHVATAYARVAREGEYRTNVGVGGRVLPWQTVLRAAFGRSARLVARRVAIAVDDIARGFARAHVALVGELAIDIGINRQGVPWLIEINSKPVRQGPWSRVAPRSLTTLLDYCTTLAGF